MDFEQKRRRQNLKVIISETIMVITMIVTVIILALVVSGYWLSPDFKVERQGMLQISSLPTGADLYVDGETSWFQRTNTSKILNSGTHTVSLQKDGYDTWEKTINVSEGLLYRIHYARLFLKDRTPETVLDAAKFTTATVSPNNKKLLLVNNTTEWAYTKLDADTLKLEPYNVANVFPHASVATGATVGLLNSEILSYDWDKNNEHVLLKAKLPTGAIEWILLDVTNAEGSLNLTKEFGLAFSSVKILDDSASSLLVVVDGNLRRLDTRAKTISSNLVLNIASFDYFDNEIVFMAKNPEGENYLGLLNLGNNEITTLETLTAPAKIVILQFYDNKYIATLTNKTLILHDKENYDVATVLETSFAPTSIKVGHHGEFITMVSGATIASLDMEDKKIHEWTIAGPHFAWLDDDMLYSVKDGELMVYDFDGLNQRSLAKNVSSHFPVTITSNKWLYYFSDGELIREAIVK